MATNYLIFSCTYFRDLDLIISNYHKCSSACQACTVTATPSAEYLMSGSESNREELSHARLPGPGLSHSTAFPPLILQQRRTRSGPPAPGHGRSDSIASRCLSLQLPTNDHSGQERFLSSSSDPGSFYIFYNHMNRGPRYNFAPSLTFRGITGDGACWSVMIPKNPGKVTQLWAALRGIKSPDLVLQSSTPIPTPAFQSSSSSGRIVWAVTPLGCQKAQDEEAELGGRRGAGHPCLGADLFCSEGPCFLQVSGPDRGKTQAGGSRASFHSVLSQTRDASPLLLIPFKNSDVLPSLIWQTLLPSLLAIGSGIQGH